jgi:hypothetical protein
MVKLFTLTSSKNLGRFATLQVFDVVTTLVGFGIGLGEANPAIGHFLPSLGPLVGLMVGKLLTVSVIIGYMMSRPKANTDKGWNFINAGFALVVSWNLIAISIRLLGLH